MTDPCASIRHVARPGSVRVDAGPGGLPRVTTTTALGRTEVFLHGAHLAAWEPAGRAPVLWSSGQARYAAGAPIRGGVPVCWPWFGAGPSAELPMHGFVRTRPWRLDHVHVDADGVASIQLSLTSDEGTRALFPHDFHLVYRITAGRSLDVSLTATNTGGTTFPVTEALHTYFAVGDIHRTTIDGLDGLELIDRNEGRGYHLRPVPPRARQAGPVAFAEEVDVNFPAHQGEALIRDPVLGRTLRVAKRGSASTQVWNPWIDKARRLADLGDHEWPGFVCVEAANAFDAAYALAPGASHETAFTCTVL